MQAPPSFHLVARRFGAWQLGLVCLGCLVIAVLAMWAVAMHQQHRLFSVGACATLACFTMLSLTSLARIPAFSLRWDGQAWWLGNASTRGHEPVAGDVTVVIDLGRWMLLRFTPLSVGGAAWPHRVRWLPIQRLGHEVAWHALRSTVHMTRPSLHLA